MGSAARCLLLAGLVALARPAAADVPVEEDGSVRGQLVLEVDTADAGAFGLNADEATVFVGRFEIRLDDAPPAGESLPDGDYTGTFTRFHVTIGDTSWDASMPHSDPLVRVVGGSASAVSVDFTKTMPSHPDLCLFLPDPEAGVGARWLALDEVDGVDGGSLEGPYDLEPSREVPALGLAGSALAVLAMIAGLRLLPGRRFRGPGGRR